MKKVLLDGKMVLSKDTKTVPMSFKSPSPAWATNLFNIVMGLSGIVSIVVITFGDYIPDKIEDIAMRSIAISLPILRLITKSFGVELKEK